MNLICKIFGHKQNSKWVLIPLSLESRIEIDSNPLIFDGNNLNVRYINGFKVNREYDYCSRCGKRL